MSDASRSSTTRGFGRITLTTVQLEALFAFPGSDVEIARHYTFDERDLSNIRQWRGTHNRFGFAVQLCYLRYPGYAMAADTTPLDGLLSHVSQQLRINPGRIDITTKAVALLLSQKTNRH